MNHLLERPQRLQEGKVPLVTVGSTATPSSTGHLEEIALQQEEEPPEWPSISGYLFFARNDAE